MRNRWQTGLTLGAAAAVVVYPPAGLALFALFALARRRLVIERSWILLWLGFGLPLLVVLAFAPHHSGGALLLTAATALVGTTVLRGPRHALVAGLLIGAALLALGGGAAQRLAAVSWQGWQPGSEPTGLRLGHQRLAPLDTGAFRRVWRAPTPPSTVVGLTFDLRGLDAGDGAAWLTSSSEITTTAMHDRGRPYLRIAFPASGDPFAYREVRLARPLAGRTFRLRAEVRSADGRGAPTPSARCRGLRFREIGGGAARACLATPLATTWTPIDATWTAPASATSDRLRVALNNLDGHTVDIADLRLEERTATGWTAIDPLAPVGFSARLSWPGGERWGETIRPAPLWTPYRLDADLTSAPPPADGRIAASLLVEPGSAVAIRNVRLATGAGPDGAGGEVALRPIAPPTRIRLHFPHPNFYGHTLAATGAVLAAVAPAGVAGGGLALAAAGVILSGSRGAWLAILIAAAALAFRLLRTLPPERRLAPAAALVLTVGVGVSVAILSGGLGRLDFVSAANPVDRPAVWRVALEALVERPAGGLGAGGFTDYWRAHTPPGVREPVGHAHNLWLELASGYGLPGLAAALWLTGGLGWLGWRRGRWRGLALVVPILVMNTVDTTLLFSGVLLPLLVGLNALHGEPPWAATSTGGARGGDNGAMGAPSRPRTSLRSR